MAPLAVYGIQDALGLWGEFGKPGTVQDFYMWIKGSWIFVEVATIAAGIIALRYYRFPFIVALIAVALWFMSMDLAPWFGGLGHLDFELSCGAKYRSGSVFWFSSWPGPWTIAVATQALPSGCTCSDC